MDEKISNMYIYIYLNLNDTMLKEQKRFFEFLSIEIFIFIKFDYKIIITKMRI